MRMIESWLRSREQDIKMVSRTMLAGIALLFIGAGIEMVIRAQAPGFAVVAAGAILVALGLARGGSR